MIVLQAAMGLGLLVIDIGRILLFAGFPLLTIILAGGANRKQRRTTGVKLTHTDYLDNLFRSLFYSILIIFIIALIIFVFLFFVVDLSDS